MQKLNLKLKEKSTKGITLIALVITIVILLILAGVSIAMLTGDNGILTQAQKAKEETEKAQENEESNLDYMNKYINKVVNNESIVLNEGTVCPLDENQFDTFDEWGNFQKWGKAEYSTDYVRNTKKSIKLTRYVINDENYHDPAIGIPVELDLSNVSNIGIWVYCPYFESGINWADCNLNVVFSGQTWVGAFNVDNCIEKTIYANAFSVGWNFLNFSIDDFTSHGNINLSDINYVLLKLSSDNKSVEHTLYVDSIVLDYKMKPTILLNYDSSSQNLYDTIYPLLKERNFVGTAFMANLSFGNDNSITKNQYQEMKNNGWDFGMYGGMNTNNGYIENTELGKNGNYDEQYKSLKAEKDLLETQGITDLVSYGCPNNATSNTNMQALNELGFKIVRAEGNYYTYPHKEITHGKGVGIIDSNLDSVKSEIDKCIKTGYALSILTHGVYENNSNTLYTDKTTYTQLLDYIKQKVDSGEMQVMSYRDFYEACSME